MCVYNYIQSLQFSDISQNNLLLSYGTQITNLQRSDISQNTLLLNLQSSDTLQIVIYRVYNLVIYHRIIYYYHMEPK